MNSANQNTGWLIQKKPIQISVHLRVGFHFFSVSPYSQPKIGLTVSSRVFGDGKMATDNDKLKEKIEKLVTLLKTKYNDDTIGHKDTDLKSVIARPDASGALGDLTPLCIVVLRANENYAFGDVLPKGTTVNGAGADRDKVSFNLLDEDPQKILGSGVFKEDFKLRGKTEFHEGACRMRVKMEQQAAADVAAGDNPQMVLLNNQINALQLRYDTMKTYAQRIKNMVNDSPPEGLQ